MANSKQSSKRPRTSPTRKNKNAKSRTSTKAATRPQRKRTAVKRKPIRRSSRSRLLVKLLIWVLVAVAMLVALWVWRLNETVVNGFAISKLSTPAHLYSRPYEITVGDSKTKTQIIAKLRERGYREVIEISSEQQFAHSAHAVDIFTQSNAPWKSTSQKGSQAVRITLQNDKIESLTDHSTGKARSSLQLSPMLLGNLGSEPVKDSIKLELHEVPELLLDAVLTMEDRRFMEHMGVDLFSIARAMASYIKPGARHQGGSTLTQQLVKNIYLDPSRTLKRKLKEAVMALLVELNFDKSEILQRYLNTLFLGQSGNRAIHGFALAAQYYYGRDLSDIDAGQLSMLVGMIPAPSAYNPVRHPQRAKKRRDLVLSTLAKNGFITPSESELYRSKALGVGEGNIAQKARYPVFIDLLSEQLEQVFDAGLLSSIGLDLYTTLDVDIQRSAEKSFKHALLALEDKHGLSKGFLQGAMMIIKPESGEIVAIIGGSDNQVAGFNRALHAKRPVGSLIKPAVYLTALQNPKRYSLTTLVVDSAISVPLETGKDWQPRNYDKQYHGTPSLYEALSHSYNIPAVKVGLDVGIDAVLTTLNRLGVETKLPPYPSLTLGAADLSVFEMAQMYQTIANQGKLQPLRTLRVVSNRAGDQLTQHDSSSNQMINPAAVYLLNTALQEVTKTGTARALQSLLPGISLGGKTGTTNDYRDSWFAGFGANYLGIVWVGNDANKSTGLTGSSGALRVWSSVMQGLDLHPIDKAIPSTVEWADVDATGAGLAIVGCTKISVSRAFVKGYAPTHNEQCNSPPKPGTWLDKWFGRKSGSKRVINKPESNR